MSMSDDSSELEGGKALVAEFVLGLLDHVEHQRVGRLIDADPVLIREKLFWEQRLATLDGSFKEVTAPTGVLRAVEERVFGAPAKASSGFWESLVLWRGLASGALAIAVVAVGMNISHPASDASALANQLVASLSEDGSNVKFVALYDGGTGSVKLVSLSGDAVPEHDYELWAIQGGNNPVSMGVIPVNSKTVVSLSPDVLKGWGAGSVLAITLEPKGGSPSGAPTGPIVAKGAVTQI